MDEIKKKKILILVNTYFQIIIAIKLKLTTYKNDDVDIIISNHSVDSYKIYESLKNISIFNKIFYFRSKEAKNKIIKILQNFCYLLFPNLSLNSKKMKLGYYDEYLFYNINKYSYLLYDALHKKNKKVKVIRFEEGYISYLHINVGISNSYKKIRKILGKEFIEEKIEYNNLFNPNLLIYNPKAPIKKIENLERKDIELRNIVNKVFKYDLINDIYDKKYIFFEESFFCDNKGIDDMDLILNIAEIVGKENLMVKLHPRNKVDRFKEYGITTNKTIGIPWEVIQMNNDFSNKVFLTISSGSVLASKLYFNDNIETYLLFNCTNKMSDMVTDEYSKYLEKIKKNLNFDNFKIPNSNEEFFKELREKKNGEKRL